MAWLHDSLPRSAERHRFGAYTNNAGGIWVTDIGSACGKSLSDPLLTFDGAKAVAQCALRWQTLNHTADASAVRFKPSLRQVQPVSKRCVDRPGFCS